MKIMKHAYVKVRQNCPDTTDGDETELNDGYSTTADQPPHQDARRTPSAVNQT